MRPDKAVASSAATSLRSSAPSKPGSTSTRRPLDSITRSVPRGCAGSDDIRPWPVWQVSTNSTGTIFSTPTRCDARRRHASSVCTLIPRAAQNSLRLRPLCSNSTTSCDAFAQLRLRNFPTSPSAFMTQLHHNTKANGRMDLLGWIRLCITCGCRHRLKRFTRRYRDRAGVLRRRSRRRRPVSCVVD